MNLIFIWEHYIFLKKVLQKKPLHFLTKYLLLSRSPVFWETELFLDGLNYSSAISEGVT